ncbi:MAG: lytic transglycosylase domain-containing protein [Blastocatellia bacterium]|nr:lytic transglycosylase domain-containing protein [Blastocatellia bacterium]
MLFRKVIVTFVLTAIVLAAMQATARAQSPAETNDPVARALERIGTVVERRAAIADRVIAASKLLNESSAARKQGERERAETALQQAETISAEIAPSQQNHLLDELARAIAAERAALNPAPPEKPQTPFTNALPVRRLTRNVVARYGDYQNTLGRILAEERVPIELLAVALVESGFNPQALSPKGARGIWQLMPATAARYGLTVEPLNDHRTHPEHSTRAAARYLRDLYQQFGDWKLALAAYNWGEGKVQRIIAKTGLRNFDELARQGLLPLETRNYVPAVLAAWEQLRQRRTK